MDMVEGRSKIRETTIEATINWNQSRITLTRSGLCCYGQISWLLSKDSKAPVLLAWQALQRKIETDKQETQTSGEVVPSFLCCR